MRIMPMVIVFVFQRLGFGPTHDVNKDTCTEETQGKDQNEAQPRCTGDGAFGKL